MSKLDYESVILNIKTAIGSILCKGFEPERLYMNSKT